MSHAPAPTPDRPNTLGAGVRSLWGFEPGLRLLNHGGFGATPLSLLEEQTRWQARMERNPVGFFADQLSDLLREAAAPLAAFVGTSADRLVFVRNATEGMNAILRSLPFVADDEIIHTDHVYNAVRNVLRYVSGRTGCRLVEAKIGMPVADSDQILSAIRARVTDRTRLVVVDHVASASAIKFPVAEIAALCRAQKIPVLVDGAHGPGLLDLDIDAIGADWYVGNGHKWLCAPKSSGFLAFSERAIAAGEVHPLAISHAFGEGPVAEFARIGTHDASACLCVPSAVRFHAMLGGAALRRRNGELAHAQAEKIAAELGTELGGARDLFEGMVTVRLPGPANPGIADTGRIRSALLQKHHVEAGIMMVDGKLFLRVSAQAYNDVDDYAGLAPALRAILA